MINSFPLFDCCPVLAATLDFFDAGVAVLSSHKT